WSKRSRPLMQRSSVLLPEPLRPIRAITSPGRTSRAMPLSTSLLPKDLRSPSMRTAGTESGADGMESRLDTARVRADGEAQDEVEGRHAGIDQEGLEGGVGDHGAGLGEFDEADHRSECGSLDHL